MSLYRSMQRGTWIVERTLLRLHIRTATGCADRDQAAAVERTLLTLARHGRRDLLLAFQQRQITGPELLAAVERQGVTFQLTVERSLALAPAIERWLKTADLRPITKQAYRYDLSRLQRGARHATLGDLPRLVARYARRAKPAMFQHVKAAAQSLVRATVPHAQHSDLWRELAGIRGPRRPARQVHGGLSPDHARRVAEALGRTGPMWWTLCCTGMGPHEYWVTRWRVRETFIEIAGTKRASRQRIVPRLTVPVRPFVARGTLADALKAAGEHLGLPRLTLYVARRTFAHWLELARLPDSRCDAYMGHAPKGMRGLYREHDVAEYLVGDAAALRQVIGADPTYVRAVG